MEEKWRWCSSNASRWLFIREIEEKWLHFNDEPHNVRFSLVVHGVNLFGELRSIYSV